MRLLVGGYSPDMEGTAAGIGLLVAGDADAALAGATLSFRGTVVEAASPSWITAHPTLDVVYATLEGEAMIRAYRRIGESAYEPWGEPVAVGELPCHILVTPTADRLWVTCWGDGRIVTIGVDATGRLRDSADLPAAEDPYPGFGEERTPHAHQSVALPGARVATTEMGLDQVRFWRTGLGETRLVQEVVLPFGSGPRHMVWHPSGHLYVITELSCEVYVLAPDATGTWRILSASAIGAGLMPGDGAAELAPSRDGEFLYGGVRGSNTIGVLRVRGAGDRLDPVALVESGVVWPRHHRVVGDTLLVAGQHSDDVAAMSLDIRTGVPGRVRGRVEVPSPTCLLPAR
ncbi:lactonase family protein [Microbacterium sediminicola]|uniref:Lactonase family protein n=1 Tax=Microbacterium sediminicola TaxID=415210 RepID=A0ABN2IEX4_9MICO